MQIFISPGPGKVPDTALVTSSQVMARWSLVLTFSTKSYSTEKQNTYNTATLATSVSLTHGIVSCIKPEV